MTALKLSFFRRPMNEGPFALSRRSKADRPLSTQFQAPECRLSPSTTTAASKLRQGCAHVAALTHPGQCPHDRLKGFLWPRHGIDLARAKPQPLLRRGAAASVPERVSNAACSFTLELRAEQHPTAGALDLLACVAKLIEQRLVLIIGILVAVIIKPCCATALTHGVAVIYARVVGRDADPTLVARHDVRVELVQPNGSLDKGILPLIAQGMALGDALARRSDLLGLLRRLGEISYVTHRL